MHTYHLNETLRAYGWNSDWDRTLSQQNNELQRLSPARVIAQFSHSYNVMTESGEHSANVTGKFEFNAAKRGDYPAVGDWVMVDRLPNENRSVIHAVLPRRTAMVRKAAGNTIEDQIIGANLDYLFIVNALNQDFNLRKIERYLIAAWESGAQPVVLLTKADLCDQPERFVAEVENAAPGVPVHFISALRDQGKDALATYLKTGNTIGITGSSGVGKSTLLNWLSGKTLQEVQGIRESDARGRHTTTQRELFLLDNGALVMDTPGMRELQLWEANDGGNTPSRISKSSLRNAVTATASMNTMSDARSSKRSTPESSIRSGSRTIRKPRENLLISPAKKTPSTPRRVNGLLARKRASRKTDWIRGLIFRMIDFPSSGRRRVHRFDFAYV